MRIHLSPACSAVVVDRATSSICHKVELRTAAQVEGPPLRALRSPPQLRCHGVRHPAHIRGAVGGRGQHLERAVQQGTSYATREFLYARLTGRPSIHPPARTHTRLPASTLASPPARSAALPPARLSSCACARCRVRARTVQGKLAPRASTHAARSLSFSPPPSLSLALSHSKRAAAALVPSPHVRARTRTYTRARADGPARMTSNSHGRKGTARVRTVRRMPRRGLATARAHGPLRAQRERLRAYDAGAPARSHSGSVCTRARARGAVQVGPHITHCAYSGSGCVF